MENTITITMSAYSELISQWQRLILLENALAKCETEEFDNILKMFDIKKEVKK